MTPPIWAYLDGIVSAEVGGIFGENFDGVSLDDMVLSGVFGVRSNANRDSSFMMTFGVGTTPLGGSVSVDSVRMVVGAGQGF